MRVSRYHFADTCCSHRPFFHRSTSARTSTRTWWTFTCDNFKTPQMPLPFPSFSHSTQVSTFTFTCAKSKDWLPLLPCPVNRKPLPSPGAVMALDSPLMFKILTRLKTKHTNLIRLNRKQATLPIVILFRSRSVKSMSQMFLNNLQKSSEIDSYTDQGRI